MKVLVVDDNTESLYLLRSIFEGGGHEVGSASNGEEALGALLSERYDLVVTDILMPVMDGFQFCRRLRATRAIRSTPVIIYTATYTGPQDEEFARNTGADLFIVKPCEPDTLLQAAVKLVKETVIRTFTRVTVPIGEEEVYRLYSQRLVRKLEEKKVLLEREVNARSETEAALRLSEARYRRLFENMRDGLVNTDAQGVILDANDSFTEMLGYESGGLKGFRVQKLVPFDPNASELKAVSEQLSSRGFSDVYRTRLKRKDGSFLPVEIRTVAAPGGNGKAEGTWSIVRDMTEAVRSEETRQSLELELFQSQKLETVGRLAGGIAHDFNNLLTVILGYTEILIQTGASSDKTREFLGLVHHAGLEARDLTRNLMAFSRRQLLNVSPIDVNAVVRDFSGLLERIAGDGVEFKLITSPASLMVLGDRSQLDQVLMNLVVNARDSMPEGGLITVETAPSNREGSTGADREYAMIRVSDKGCGMDDETVKHIFEPFFSTKGKEKGTGLGLATTYGIVKQHQGSISVRTKPGSGTSMIVCLPLTDQQPTEAKPEASLVEPVSGSATVLVMEDDPVIRSLSAKVLRDTGYNVIEALDSREAVAMCGRYEGPIHLILSDMVMPGMSGTEACEEIRKLRPETRVLFMSGFNDGMHTFGAGHAFDGFIQKPFTVNNLLDKCRQILGTPLRTDSS